MKYTFTQDWFSHNVAHLENAIKNEFPSKSNIELLELGTFEGLSTVWFVERIPQILKNCLINITSVDDFRKDIKPLNGINMTNIHQNALKNIKLANTINSPNKISFVQNSTNNFFRSNSLEFDIVYIDGDHSSRQTIFDAMNAFEVLRSDGIIIFDDYLGGNGDYANLDVSPKFAIDTFVLLYSKQIKIIFQGYQLIVKKIS
jgi:predicted O-methyltransferase YrrM